MLLSELATGASGLDEAAFVAAHPRPALVFYTPGARIGDSDDETLHGEGLWARTAPGSGAGATPADGSMVQVDLAPVAVEGAPLVAFLKKSRRNPFGGLVVLGRQPRADVVVASSSISKVHLIFAEGVGHPGWTVLDQHSTNGTTVNGFPLELGRPARLHDGDVLVVGGVVRATFAEPRTVFCLVDTWRRGEPLGEHGWVRVASPPDGTLLPPPPG